MPSTTGLRFPFSRVLLPRTRLAYVHLRNLLTDAKRDRAARISGYVAVSLPEELVMLYLVRGEVANATIRNGRGSRAVPISAALETVPQEPEYGEVCFHEADEEQLACMFASHAQASEPWPDGFSPGEATSLFPYLMAMTFDGVVEIVANENVNYLVFRNGSVARAFLTSGHHGTVVDRVAKLFAREGRVGELRVARWSCGGPLPVQASPALVQAYRELAAALVRRFVDHGRESAPALAEQARQTLASTHGALESFSFAGQSVSDPLCDAASLTADVAAWIREVMWTALDHEVVAPEALLKELTWERRHVFQSAGLFEQIPWKVM